MVRCVVEILLGLNHEVRISQSGGVEVMQGVWNLRGIPPCHLPPELFGSCHAQLVKSKSAKVVGRRFLLNLVWICSCFYFFPRPCTREGLKRKEHLGHQVHHPRCNYEAFFCTSSNRTLSDSFTNESVFSMSISRNT